jgi:hypothetical protein
MVKTLQAASNKFSLKANKILVAFKATSHRETITCCSITHERARSICVIDLHSAWNQFCRDLFFLSSIGGVITRSNQLLTRSNLLSSNDNLITALRRTYPRPKPSFWEPHWSIASEFIDVCTRLQIVNLSNVSAAIGSTGSVADEVRFTRNYLSHRKTDTAIKALDALSHHGASSPLDIDSLLLVFVPAGVSLFEHWVTNLSLISFAACD